MGEVLVVGCLSCGSDIQNKRKDAKYCSNKCGNRVRRKRHYISNPTYYKKKRVRESKNYIGRVYTRIKSRARISGIEFNLDRSDIIVPTHCPILGIEILTNHGVKGFHPQSISVDRIDNTKGYIKGNIQVISGRANVMKNDANPEELLRFAKWIGDNYGRNSNSGHRSKWIL